jgi:hypothetical protein
MIKNDNISKKKLWGFAKFNTTKHEGNKIEIYEEIFNLNFEINQLKDQLNGFIEIEEKIKILSILENKKIEIESLELKLITIDEKK